MHLLSELCSEEMVLMVISFNFKLQCCHILMVTQRHAVDGPPGLFVVAVFGPLCHNRSPCCIILREQRLSTKRHPCNHLCAYCILVTTHSDSCYLDHNLFILVAQP